MGAFIRHFMGLCRTATTAGSTGAEQKPGVLDVGAIVGECSVLPAMVKLVNGMSSALRSTCWLSLLSWCRPSSVEFL